MEKILNRKRQAGNSCLTHAWMKSHFANGYWLRVFQNLSENQYNRQLLRRKSFENVEQLEATIRVYVIQYNELFAHPYKWTYDGVPKQDDTDVERLIGESS